MVGIPVFQDTVFTEVIIDENDCETTIYTAIFVLNNVQSQAADLYFKIAPNPTRNVVNILFENEQNQEAVFEILNINGQVLQEGILDGQTINLEDLAEGIYFIKMKVST